jgi:hypothetical protein
MISGEFILRVHSLSLQTGYILHPAMNPADKTGVDR